MGEHNARTCKFAVIVVGKLRHYNGELQKMPDKRYCNNMDADNIWLAYLDACDECEEYGPKGGS